MYRVAAIAHGCHALPAREEILPAHGASATKLVWKAHGNVLLERLHGLARAALTAVPVVCSMTDPAESTVFAVVGSHGIVHLVETTLQACVAPEPNAACDAALADPLQRIALLTHELRHSKTVKGRVAGSALVVAQPALEDLSAARRHLHAFAVVVRTRRGRHGVQGL